MDLRRKDSSAAGSLLLSLTWNAKRTHVSLERRLSEEKTPQKNNGGRLHLNSDREAVIPEGLEAETARLLGGLPHRHEVP